MLTEATLLQAQKMAEELRRRGELAPAELIETIIEETRQLVTPPLDLLTSTQAGELFGVTGQTIKNWVREGQLQGFRIGGRIMIPRATLVDYIERARTSLDLEDLSDEEAAAVVAEGRQRR